MDAICRFRRLPRPLRLLLAVLAFAAGLPLFLSPLPGGVVLLALGTLLLSCVSRPLRRCFLGRLRRSPGLYARLSPWLTACDRCQENRPETDPPHGSSSERQVDQRK